jgi:hypothetical protein
MEPFATFGEAIQESVMKALGRNIQAARPHFVLRHT